VKFNNSVKANPTTLAQRGRQSGPHVLAHIPEVRGTHHQVQEAAGAHLAQSRDGLCKEDPVRPPVLRPRSARPGSGARCGRCGTARAEPRVAGPPPAPPGRPHRRARRSSISRPSWWSGLIWVVRWHPARGTAEHDGPGVEEPRTVVGAENDLVLRSGAAVTFAVYGCDLADVYVRMCAAPWVISSGATVSNVGRAGTARQRGLSGVASCRNRAR
jgi:hypothetical protein